MATNADVLYRQFKALGEATAEALTQIEARLATVEAHTHEPLAVDPSDSAVPV